MKNALILAMLLMSSATFARPGHDHCKTQGNCKSGHKHKPTATCTKTVTVHATSYATPTMTVSGGTFVTTPASCTYTKYKGKKGRGHGCCAHHGPPRHTEPYCR